jgi:hypothetical protein
MKRRWNLSLWAGAFIMLFGLGSYVPIFSLFPVTRDFPWANLLLLLAGGILLGRGLMRAYRQPELYRGRIFGTFLSALCLAGTLFFGYGLFYLVRQIPAAPNAPRVGQKAPDFTLPDQNGKPVALAELLSSPIAGAGAIGAETTKPKPAGALLIFYRGHW